MWRVPVACDTVAMHTLRERAAGAFGDLSRRSLRRLRSLLPASERIVDEDVLWAYRILLDREPENDRVVADKLAALRSRRELCEHILLSPECRARNANAGLFANPCVVIKETTFGPRIFLDLMDVFVCQAIARDRYELHETALVQRLLRPGQVAVDVGANVGYYTLLFASIVGAQGKVHAFEPFPGIADLLARSIAENAFEPIVDLRRRALGDRHGRELLVHAPHTANAGGAYLSLSHESPPAGHDAFEVPVTRLDDEDLRRPIAFLKLDSEGAEPLVLAGASEILERDRPVVLCELHRRQLARVSAATPRDVIDTMRAHDYACHRLAGGTIGGRVRDTEDEIASVVFVPDRSGAIVGASGVRGS